jgi:ketosteroid isomerase-like protein
VSDESVEIVRGAFAAFNDGGTEAFLPFVHPEVVFTTPSDLASEPDTYRGLEGVRRYWDSFFEIMEEIQVELVAVYDWGDALVVGELLLKARGRATGLEVSQRANTLITIADGKAIGQSFYRTLEEAEHAAEAAGGTRPG